MSTTTTKPRETFVTAQVAARRLGVPLSWFIDEVEAGRIPFLPAGRRSLFNVEAVERVLLERMSEQREAAHA